VEEHRRSSGDARQPGRQAARIHGIRAQTALPPNDIALKLLEYASPGARSWLSQEGTRPDTSLPIPRGGPESSRLKRIAVQNQNRFEGAVPAYYENVQRF
jgi:hypothetical protein